MWIQSLLLVVITLLLVSRKPWKSECLSLRFTSAWTETWELNVGVKLSSR